MLAADATSQRDRMHPRRYYTIVLYYSAESAIMLLEPIQFRKHADSLQYFIIFKNIQLLPTLIEGISLFVEFCRSDRDAFLFSIAQPVAKVGRRDLQST